MKVGNYFNNGNRSPEKVKIKEIKRKLQLMNRFLVRQMARCGDGVGARRMDTFPHQSILRNWRGNRSFHWSFWYKFFFQDSKRWNWNYSKLRCDHRVWFDRKQQQRWPNGMSRYIHVETCPRSPISAMVKAFLLSKEERKQKSSNGCNCEPFSSLQRRRKKTCSSWRPDRPFSVSLIFGIVRLTFACALFVVDSLVFSSSKPSRAPYQRKLNCNGQQSVSLRRTVRFHRHLVSGKSNN